MSPVPLPPPETESAPEPPDKTTGFPGLPTWRGVYLFVILVFVAYVVFLITLSGRFA